MNPEIKTGNVISTDCIGLFGNPQWLTELYDPALRNVELLAWRWMGHTKKVLEDNGFTISHLHGPAGTKDNKVSLLNKAVLAMVEQTFTPLETLILNYAYLPTLVHETVFDDSKNHELVKAHASKLTSIYVENHFPGEEGVNRALQQIQTLGENGVSSALVFDICHFIGADNLQSEQFGKSWDDAVAYMADTLGSIGVPLIIHLATGKRRDDSVPIDNKDIMSDGMIKNYAIALQKTKPIKHVVESQHQNIRHNLGWLTQTDRIKKRRRNDFITDRLVAQGAVTL